jgi:hypothetical protein
MDADRPARGLADMNGSLKPIHFWHLHVHQNDIVPLSLQGSERFDPIAGEIGSIAEPLQGT